MVKKYFDFINENLEFLLESDVKYSEKFRKVLKKIGGSVSDALLDLENKDYPIQSNYFDITDGNDTISFTPDRKVKELLDKNANKWRYAESGRNIDPNEKYQYLWDGLGLKREERNNEPQIGTMGTLGKEFISPASGKKFVVFIPDNEEYKPIGVNMEALRLGPGDSETNFFTLSRQTIRVGRGIRALLNTAKVKVADKDVEEFVNKYKSTIDALNDIFSHFDIVKGDEISHWYNYSNYELGTNRGTLGSSCMADVDENFFDIYCNNPDKVSLVLYKSPDNSDKIKGRSLVWLLDDGKMFMDRIYTHEDSDVELFRQFAKKNGWYCKYRNASGSEGSAFDKDGNKVELKLTVTLKAERHDKYPYLDTFKYYSPSTGIISNNSTEKSYCLEDTDGGYTNCDTCDGDGRIECEECNGSGNRDCNNCDGDGRIDCNNCDGDGDFECSTCDGDGFKKDKDGNILKDSEGENIKCPDCHGDGKVECEECDGGGRRDCPDCDGDGNYECGECDGRGTVECPECQ
jgi:hypothetical protein